MWVLTIDANIEVDKDVEVDVCVEMSIIGCTVTCPLTTCAADMKTPHWTTTPLILLLQLIDMAQCIAVQ